jgi:demethylmenaquinone methyltransferase / 2-methoxy-6-polyprenyl-1,4-benzoquinol methylase
MGFLRYFCTLMYQHDSIVPDTESRAGKKEQVAEMFDQIAGRYDFFNRLLSGGIDRGWRKKALRELKDVKPETLLDVATGTADVAIMAQKLLRPALVTGIDISENMLAIGREKVQKAGYQNVIKLETGDSETINYPDASFDAVTVAFGVRNFENLEKGLAEIYRVLKPGGKAVILEFSKPKRTGWRKIYNVYAGIVAPKMVGAFSKNKKAYQYLNQSVNAFPEREAFRDIMTRTGFSGAYFKILSLGICCIYCGGKQ